MLMYLRLLVSFEYTHAFVCISYMYVCMYIFMIFMYIRKFTHNTYTYGGGSVLMYAYT